MYEQPSEKSLLPLEHRTFRSSEAKEPSVVFPSDEEKVIKVESKEELKENQVENESSKNVNQSQLEYLTVISFKEKELQVACPSWKGKPVKVESSNESKDISIERERPSNVEGTFSKLMETPGENSNKPDISTSLEFHDELKAPRSVEDNNLRWNKPFIAPFMKQNRVIRADELENFSSYTYPNYFTSSNGQVWVGEWNSSPTPPPTNQFPANSYYTPDILTETLSDNSSAPSYVPVDCISSDSDYSSTNISNSRQLLVKKPDILQTFKYKRETFNAKMKCRETEIWNIPEMRELIQVLKQTVMRPIATLLITYAAPSNWVSCFYCGAFVETHCCLRKFKIDHGISFKC